MKPPLDRRDFLKAGSAGLAGLTLIRSLPGEAGSAGSAPSTRRPLSKRRVFPLNSRWLYSEKNLPGGAALRFDEKRFARVTIPHTNKVVPWHSFDEKDYMFVSLYRRHFRLPSYLQGQRVFVDFAGVMTAAVVHINGQGLGEYKGGYTPFSFELTPHINWAGDNVLAVEVDSTERADVPPFGGLVDYLTFGGIYREVELRAVSPTYIENVFAKPQRVLDANGRRLHTRCYLRHGPGGPGGAARKLTVELREGQRIISQNSAEITPANSPEVDVVLTGLDAVELWDLHRPKLYDVLVKLFEGPQCVDHYSARVGFREARFTTEGFYLNGRRVKLRGLNRHQTYPYVGQAMPARVQKRDAWILRKELKCNIVRTSHYPQATSFLDGCDEYGLLVLEEIPGWQHIGDQNWKDLSVHYVDAMVRRDWNHPSVVLWGVRINESRDDHDFYARTNAVAHGLDDSRQTGGIRHIYNSELLEDVFTMNDFGFPLRPPNHPLYLNTEFNGHMYPTKQNDNVERITEHTVRHARVHNQIASDNRYAGGIGWCAFDYNTHDYFGSGDRVCYHGVSDIFRIPKPAAGFYKSQCDPQEEIVLEPGFHWARGDRNESFTIAMICSNCEQVKLYLRGKLIAEAPPDRENYGHLRYPPFVVNLRRYVGDWGDLRMEGYIGGKLVITRTLSGAGVDRQFHVEPDDKELVGDGTDATRVVLRVTEEFGGARPFATGAIAMTIEGPGEIIGENPFALFGGVGAVWVRAKEGAGVIRLMAKHPVLGAKTVEISVARPDWPGEV